MLSQKRRKKRQSHGLRTVELQRGKQGYGFTISGQQPCVLGNIIAGSPADDQGLKDGDHLVTVNGLAVSQLSHEKVVKVIGSCSGALKVQIAEMSRVLAQHNDSDSSDEQYVKPRYTHRTRSRSNSKTAHLPSEPSQRRGTASAHLSQHTAVSKGASLSLPPRADPFPTIYHPMQPINGRASDFGVIRHHQHQEHRVGDYYRQGLNSRGQVLPGFNGKSGGGQLVRSNSVPDVSALDTQATDLSKILYPAMQPMAISSSSTINADDDQPSLRVIVGYIGSIEMPQDSNLPSSRLQSIRSAVRRLRVEQKVHTLVLLEIRPDGIKLINPMGATIVHYPVKRLAMSGMYPDDKRFFGLVTIQEEDEAEPGAELSSSCHVFMVDPEFSKHNIHSAKAKAFGIHCTIDPTTHRCIEFPKSCSPILRTAAKLYKDKHGGIFDVPRRQERPASSDSDTNSDSGLGFHKDQDEQENAADRVYVVDIHIPGNNSDSSTSQSCDMAVPPASLPPPHRSQSPSKSALAYARDGVVPTHTRDDAVPPYTRDGAGRGDRRFPVHQSLPNHAMSSFNSRASSSGSETRGAAAPKAKLSLSATVQSSKAISPAALSQTTMDPRTVEQLRSNMQRLLAMRKENIRDTQSLSDTESVLSDVRSRGSSGSRVSFNPRVAIATHNYPILGAVGGRSSGSDSSSYIHKRDPPSHSSLYSEVPPRTRRQRAARPDTLTHTPKSRPPPPPVPPKPSLTTQRALEELHQQELYIKQQHQEAIYKQQQQLQRQLARSELTVKSLTLDDRAGRGAPNYALTVRASDTLDSKLSPRAYPSVAPRPSRVATSERSAFQKVSPDAMNPSSPLNFYSTRNYNENNNNNRKPPAVNGANGAAANSRTASTVPGTRPVPAPRRLSRPATQENSVPQSRSCSVPPTMRSWFQVGRELNVDDGLSVRSASIQSLRRAARKSAAAADKPENARNGITVNTRPQDSSYTPAEGSSSQSNIAGGLQDKSLSSESLVEVGTRNVDRTNHATMGKQTLNNNNVGRVASWAVSFENLLQDSDGVKAFSGYLKLEYSEENMKFWLACEHFKTITDPLELRKVAVAMYDTYIGGTNCSLTDNETVNIDSRAIKMAEQRLDNPTVNMFDEAQSQVFRLMKTDSYTRFIKSEFYQKCLVREFENSKEKSGPSSLASDSSDTQKRKPFPMFFMGRKFGGNRSDDSSLERSRPVSAGKSKKYDTSLTADLKAMKYRIDSGGSQDEADEERLLRVVLPDGSTSVIQAKQSDSLRSLLATLLSKKTDLAINSIDVFPLESDRALDVSLRLIELPCQELRVERRVIVRLELPNKKLVGVKAKPHRTIRDVAKPILQKYGFDINHVVITQNGEPVNQEQAVLHVDNVRLNITLKEQYQDWGISKKTQNAQDALDDMIDFENVLSGDTLSTDSISKKSKGSQLLGMLKNYSLDDSKSTFRKSKGKNVTFGPTKSMDDRYLAKPTTNEKFLDMLTKIQSCRLNDQRGLSIDVGEMPDFLKSGDQHSEEGSMSPPQTRSTKDTAHSLHSEGNSANYNDQPPHGIPQAPAVAVMSASDDVGYRLSQHSTVSPNINSVRTRPYLNDSYHSAIAAGEDNFSSRSNDMNSTLIPANRTSDNTLTPTNTRLPLSPLSPLPTNLPPPPQFGNEMSTSTPVSASTRPTTSVPPPYQEAITRSSLASSFNSNHSNNSSSSSYHTNTIASSNPGNRLSLAHHQPIIFHDEADELDDCSGRSPRSTPSPTTHSLIFNTEEPVITNRNANESTPYNFYERQYNVELPRSTPATEPVKVTFV